MCFGLKNLNTYIDCPFLHLKLTIISPFLATLILTLSKSNLIVYINKPFSVSAIISKAPKKLKVLKWLES